MRIPYQVGSEYHRKEDLHGQFGGSQQSGMCPSARHPIIFLFTGPSGEQHGYSDGFTDSGMYHYTGEGQRGDMDFNRGNLALRNHVSDGKHALLFEQSKPGFCRYLGEVVCTGHHTQLGTDTEGNTRTIIIFELAFDSLAQTGNFESKTLEDQPQVKQKDIARLPLAQLRELAQQGKAGAIVPKSVTTRVFYRSEAVKNYALKRASGHCEGCQGPAPFRRKSDHTPYLEVHHLTRVADGGPDLPEHVAALCANCHRRAHYSHDASDFGQLLINRIKAIEANIHQ
jgi:5-methylcytosine-specific restriction protein A